MRLGYLIGTHLCLSDAQRAMLLSMLVAVKVRDIRSRFTLLDLTARPAMPQNMVYAWTQILR